MNPVLPVYYQIKETIKNWIINREYNPGDKIPSENQLAEMFDVSRITVRQAITQLVHEGFLISKQGQGSFVIDDEKLIDSFGLEFTGFMDDLFYHIQKTTTKSVEIKKIQIPKFVRGKLEMDESIEEIIEVKRVRLKSGKCFAYTINYIPIEIGTQISEEALLKKPMLQIMEKDLGIKFNEAFQTIEATFADREVAEKLNLQLGSPILFAERIMYNEKGESVELVQSSYRGDLYKYIVRLKSFRRNNKNIWMHHVEHDD